jgi:hypothetical protein
MIDYYQLHLESENEYLKEILQKICYIKSDQLMIKDKIELDKINDIYFLKKFVFNKKEKTLFD